MRNLANGAFALVLSFLLSGEQLALSKSRNWLPSIQPSSFKAIWTDASGNPSPLSLPFDTQLMWKAQGPYKLPVVRTRLRLPPGAKIQMDHPAVPQPGVPVPSNAPAPTIVDIETIPDTLSIKLQKPDGTAEALSLRFLPTSEESLWILHPSCARSGISIQGSEAVPKFSIAAAYCVDLQDRVKLYLSHSSKTQIVSSQPLPQTLQPETGPNFTAFTLIKPISKPPADLKPVTSFALTEANSPLSQHQVFIRVAPTSSNFTATVGVGVTGINFSQTAREILNEVALATKVAAEYRFGSSRWDIGGNVFYNPLVLMSNQESTIQFFGANVRVGFTLTSPLSPWQFKLMAGGYFVTSFANPAVFGFRNISGPQLYPQLRRIFSQGQATWVYFKFSPIFSGISLLGLANSEIAAGGGFQFSPFSNGHRMSLSLDGSLIQFMSAALIQSYSLTLGVNYGF